MLRKKCDQIMKLLQIVVKRLTKDRGVSYIDSILQRIGGKKCLPNIGCYGKQLIAAEDTEFGPGHDAKLPAFLTYSV